MRKISEKEEKEMVEDMMTMALLQGLKYLTDENIAMAICSLHAFNERVDYDVFVSVHRLANELEGDFGELAKNLN